MKDRRGRPAFRPTKEQRLQVRVWTACGFPQEFLRTMIINQQTGKPITAKTLAKVFRAELDEAKVWAVAKVADSLFRKAIGNGPQSVTAAIFYLKTQGRWKEVPQTHELTGPDGAPLSPPVFHIGFGPLVDQEADPTQAEATPGDWYSDVGDTQH